MFTKNWLPVVEPGITLCLEERSTPPKFIKNFLLETNDAWPERTQWGFPCASF